MACRSSVFRPWALEFTADQVTKIDGRTHKANIYYRDTMWRIEHHSMGPVNVSIVAQGQAGYLVAALADETLQNDVPTVRSRTSG